MSISKQITDAFGKLRFKQQVLAIAAVAVVIALGANLALLKPQRLQIAQLVAATQSNQAALEVTMRSLADLENDAAKGIDKFAGERATLAEYKRQIAEADTFFTVSTPAMAQVDGLITSLIKGDANITLGSLKILPVEVFYSPPVQAKPQATTTIGEIMAKTKKEEAPQLVLSEKPLYKHGVEVTMRGSYPALVDYLRRLQSLEQRLFWSSVSIRTSKPGEASLSLTIYSVSDQASAPLG